MFPGHTRSISSVCLSSRLCPGGPRAKPPRIAVNPCKPRLGMQPEGALADGPRPGIEFAVDPGFEGGPGVGGGGAGAAERGGGEGGHLGLIGDPLGALSGLHHTTQVEVQGAGGRLGGQGGAAARKGQPHRNNTRGTQHRARTLPRIPSSPMARSSRRWCSTGSPRRSPSTRSRDGRVSRASPRSWGATRRASTTTASAAPSTRSPRRFATPKRPSRPTSSRPSRARGRRPLRHHDGLLRGRPRGQ
jgi:hypothetical protein